MRQNLRLLLFIILFVLVIHIVLAELSGDIPWTGTLFYPINYTIANAMPLCTS